MWSTVSVAVLITEIEALPLLVTKTRVAPGLRARDQGRSPTGIWASTAPAALETVTVSLSGFTFQIRSAPLLFSTIRVVECRGADGSGVTTSRVTIGITGVEVSRAAGVG